MVLVLQRRVLVMGPRIILRGAIPIDSNIGGSDHRPLLGEFVSQFCLCCLLPLFLRAELVLVVSSVLALWCGLSLEGSMLLRPLFWLKLSFLELTVLPRPTTVLPQGGGTVLPHPARQEFFTAAWGSGTTASVRYFCLGGTTAMTCNTTA